MADWSSEALLTLDVQLPRHVAIIMDGNGRWANMRELSREEGHRAGANAVRDIVEAACELKLSALTLYAFSLQNWQRPKEEVDALMNGLETYLIQEYRTIMDNDIALRVIGETKRLPSFVHKVLDKALSDSAKNNDMILTLALSYGGRESIVDAATQLLKTNTHTISEETMTAALPTAGLPPLDLLIRTSGEKRISNFLLWESAYAELYFDDALWPDYNRQNFYAALLDYVNRERRFGLTTEQMKSLQGCDG